MDILSPGALQSLGLPRDFLDTSPWDMTDVDDTVCQHSLSLPDINPEPSDLQGLGGMGPDLQVGHSATSNNNLNVPRGDPDHAMGPRKRLAPRIIVFPAADGQGKRQRKRFNDAKRQEVA